MGKLLNRSNFLIAKLASTDEDAKGAYKGLLITPDGTQVCDGHLAVTVSAVTSQQLAFEYAEGVEPADFWSPFILDRDSALKIAAAIPKKTDNPDARYGVVDCTTENNERAMISVNDLQRQAIVRSRKIDDKFPDLSRIVPDRAKAKLKIKLDPNLLLSLLKAITVFCAANQLPGIELSFHGKGKPIRIDATGIEQELVAVMMPQRAPGEEEEPE